MMTDSRKRRIVERTVSLCLTCGYPESLHIDPRDPVHGPIIARVCGERNRAGFAPAIVRILE
jgi:hypothetical protein